MTIDYLQVAEQKAAAAGLGDSRIEGAVIGNKHLEVICESARTSVVAGLPKKIGGGVSNDAAMKLQSRSAYQPEEISASLTSMVQAAVTTLSMQPMGAPPLVKGDQLENYTITETIVQGWLYKKGTGGDFSGRRWWKPRWVTLALAENPDTVVPVVILLSHRAPGVPYPANIIELTESTVIMATEHKYGESIPVTKIAPTEGEKLHSDTPSEEEWNRYCFQIVDAKHQDNETTPKTTTRIFTAPVVERNEWVFAMNNALLSYTKRLGKARRRTAAKQEFQAQQARVFEYERPIFCDEVEEEKKEQQMQQLHRQPWTNDSHIRMRSLSPLRERTTMGRPPTSPRPIRLVRPCNDTPQSATI